MAAEQTRLIGLHYLIRVDGPERPEMVRVEMVFPVELAGNHMAWTLTPEQAEEMGQSFIKAAADARQWRRPMGSA
jgi:hypothetical protein